MKKLLISLIVFLAMVVVTVNAADLRFTASTGDVAGYNAYWGTVEGEYPNHSDIGNVTEVIDIVDRFNLHPNRTYYFVVTAYNASGESPAGNIANHTTESYTPPPDVMEERPSSPSDPADLIVE